jgi:divalent metal cation (Fe/Co/Zn/Cd) transporter
MTLGEVHHVISELESRLHREFALLRRVTVHAEPD